jgi:hypothetical protein
MRPLIYMQNSIVLDITQTMRCIIYIYIDIIYIYGYIYIYMATCKYLLSKLSIMEAGSGEEGPAAWRPGRHGVVVAGSPAHSTVVKG